jgi:hypothetical protein
MPAYRQPSVTRLFERHKAPWARDGVAAPDDAVLQLCDHHDDLFERPSMPEFFVKWRQVAKLESELGSRRHRPGARNHANAG